MGGNDQSDLNRGASALELFESAQKHCPTARETLIRRLYPCVEAFLSSRIATSPHLHSWLSDITQEAMLRIDKNIWTCRFVEDDALFGWCLKVARSVLVDHIRRHKRRAAETTLAISLEGSFGSEFWRYRQAFGTSDADFVGSAAFRRSVNEILDALDGEQSTLLWQRIVEGRSWRDVGRSLGISDRAARQRWRRLAAHLRTHIAAAASSPTT